MAYPYGGPGYPPSGPGYPPGGPGYPPAGPGYPPDAGYPPAGYPPAPGGYPPAQGGYPPAQGGYPPAPGGYPPAPGSYPPTGGYPPAVGGYPPPGGYPPTTGGYGAPPAGGYPPTTGGYNSGPPPPGVTPGYGAPPPGAQPYGSHQQPPQQSYAMHQQPHSQSMGHSQPPPAHAQPVHQSTAPASQGAPPQRPPPPSNAAGSAPPTTQLASMSLNQKTLKYGNPTVKPISPFDAEADCELLRKAMRGMGTNEQALIDIIAQRSNAQRVEIRKRFKTMFGKDLMNELKSELSGNLEGCLLALMEPSSLYDAKCLRRAMRGAGTDEETLIDILCTRTNTEILEIKRSYTEYYKRDLEKDCVSETSGHFKRLLVSMCQANRDESTTVDLAKATKEAQDLFQAGEKKWGTDESRFNVVLASRSFVQLRATFEEYIKISQRDILNSIDREMSGDLKAGFKCIVQCARNPAEYFADRLWKSMKGAGTNDDLLIRIIVSRSEVDLVEIKQAFLLKYHKTVYKMIEGDCSGDYKKLLFSIVGRN